MIVCVCVSRNFTAKTGAHARWPLVPLQAHRRDHNIASVVPRTPARQHLTTATMCLERSMPDMATTAGKRNNSSSSIVALAERRLSRNKICKPKLPRKISPSCIINLNKFWSELEEVYVSRTSNKVLAMDSEEEMENSINENLERSLQLPSATTS